MRPAVLNVVVACAFFLFGHVDSVAIIVDLVLILVVHVA